MSRQVKARGTVTAVECWPDGSVAFVSDWITDRRIAMLFKASRLSPKMVGQRIEAVGEYRGEDGELRLFLVRSCSVVNDDGSTAPVDFQLMDPAPYGSAWIEPGAAPPLA